MALRVTYLSVQETLAESKQATKSWQVTQQASRVTSGWGGGGQWGLVLGIRAATTYSVWGTRQLGG